MAEGKTGKRIRTGSAAARSKGRAAKAIEKVDPAAPVVCQHHWQIGRPDSQISHGVCSKCGEERDFLNYGEELRMPFGRRRRR